MVTEEGDIRAAKLLNPPAKFPPLRPIVAFTGKRCFIAPDRGARSSRRHFLFGVRPTPRLHAVEKPGSPPENGGAAVACSRKSQGAALTGKQ